MLNENKYLNNVKNFIKEVLTSAAYNVQNWGRKIYFKLRSIIKDKKEKQWAKQEAAKVAEYFRNDVLATKNAFNSVFSQKNNG